ncbi:MAG: ribonuclease P protein component [Puniceicoccales bacterium]
MRFSRECRLRKSSEFIRLRRVGKWVPGRYFHLQVCEREDRELPSRMGLAVSRRVGPAVTRNLVKRRFREIFRATTPEFSVSLEIVVIARKGVHHVPFSELKQQFAHALRAWRNGSTLRVNG